jgi:hypothetical protein
MLMMFMFMFMFMSQEVRHIHVARDTVFVGWLLAY